MQLTQAQRSGIEIAFIAAFSMFLGTQIRELFQESEPAEMSKPDEREVPVRFQETKWYTPGATGVTYSEILNPYLSEAHSLVIVDPYIQAFHQIRNLRELLMSLAPTGARRELSVKLVTSEAKEQWRFDQSRKLQELQADLSELGVVLTIEYDDSIHDRWIRTSEWTILLGKGLDIWDQYRGAKKPQWDRPIAKMFSITYIKESEKESPVRRGPALPDGEEDQK